MAVTMRRAYSSLCNAQAPNAVTAGNAGGLHCHHQRRWLAWRGGRVIDAPKKHVGRPPSKATDFGLNQPAPDPDRVLTSRVLNWRNGMEWIDITGRMAQPKKSVSDSPEERAEKDAWWQQQVIEFRAALEPELMKLDISEASIARSSMPHALPRIVAVETKTRPATPSEMKAQQEAQTKPGPTVRTPHPRTLRRKIVRAALEDDKIAAVSAYVTLAAPRKPRLQTSHMLAAAEARPIMEGGLQAPSTSLNDDLFVEAGGASPTSGAPSCPLQRPSSPSHVTVEHTEFTGVCALFRYSPNDESSGVAFANRRIDVFANANTRDKTSPEELRSQGPMRRTLSVARGGLVRTIRSVATSLYHDASPLDSIQDITHRVTMFAMPNRLVTVHIHDVPFITKIRTEWDDWYRHSGPLHVANAIVKECGKSFKDASFAEALLIDRLENLLYRTNAREYDQCLRLLYAVSRRSSIHTRVLAPMPATHRALCQALGVPDNEPHVQDVQTTLQMGRVMAQDVRDATQGLLSLHFQRSASELEAMMRVLTIFSAVFIPLEMVTSFFGMNCPNLPWLEDGYGPLKACGVMAMGTGITVAWFRLRHFL
jgi:magnesium transporter